VTEEAVTVVNFTDHPLTDAQRVQLADLMDLSLARVVDVPAHVDLQAPLVPQVRDLVASVGWDAETWQTQPVVINPPGLAPLTAVLLAELHGRLGYFPTLMRVRPVADVVPRRYEVAELLNLQAVRDAARRRR
jgi:hypothetical protein